MDPLKTLHVSCAVLSVSGFILRGAWMWRGSPWLKARITRILPHVIDSLLLAAGIGLAVRAGQYPFVNTWLTAKFVALILYIALGSIALKRGRTRRTRLLAFGAALAVFLYIIAVAVTRSAAPGFTGFRGLA
jgi:uncharacterized membrane protein SirB2